MTYTPMIKFLQRLGRDDASTDSIRCAQTAESDATQARFSHISDADVFIYFLSTFHFSQPWTGCADAASREFLSASWAQLVVLCCTVGFPYIKHTSRPTPFTRCRKRRYSTCHVQVDRVLENSSLLLCGLQADGCVVTLRASQLGRSVL